MRLKPSKTQASCRGFTFLELSFTLMVMGLIAAMMAQIVPAMRKASATAETVRNLTTVKSSLEAFAAIQGRLPCADGNSDGLEDASPCLVIGKLPYRTLGFSGPLVNAEGFDFKYAMYQRGGTNLRQDALLGTRKERYQPAIGQASSGDVQLTEKSYAASASGTFKGNQRLDFCQGLRAGMDGSFDPGYLNIDTGSSRQHVAYVLIDPGVGNMDLLDDQFDGFNSTANASNPRFEHPNRKQSISYDDKAEVAYFDQFWEILGCSAAMATTGRAHPNVETTLALFKQSLTDYGTQMDIAVDAAFADNFSAGAGIALATTGLAMSGASMVTDIASNINKMGATVGASISAGLAIGLNAAALVVAIANQVLTTKNYYDFKDLRDEFDNTIVKSKFNPLYESVKQSVSRSGELIYSDQ